MSTEFKAAAEQVKKLKTAPTNDEKLEVRFRREAR
jgi:acyl-CoA-binding protein